MTVTVNGRPAAFGDDATVAAVVASVGAQPTGTAVAVNGEVVPRSAWNARRIGDGDVVEVLAAVQGG